jgi:hypothetical protein
MAKRRQKPPSHAVVATVLCVMGTVAVALAWLLLDGVRFEPARKARQAAEWPRVPCIILSIGVDTVSTRGASRSGSSSPGYGPRVQYHYDVDGRRHIGTRLWLGQTLFNTRAEVEEIIRPYPTGSAHRCFVDPRDPARAVLTVELFDRKWLGWLWLVLFGLAGAAVIAGGIAITIWKPTMTSGR